MPHFFKLILILITRISKILAWSLGVIVVLAFVAWFTGHGYLISAIQQTYLSGQHGPDIFDENKFYQSEIVSSEEPSEWDYHSQYNNFEIKEVYLNEMERLEIVAYLVIHEGKILHEQYWGDEMDESHRTNSFSMAKSVVSLLIGIAVEDGAIESIDNPVGKYLKHFNKGKYKDITIRDLLTMSSGLNWEESPNNPMSDNARGYYGHHLNRLINSLRVIDEPGKNFVYKSGNTQILGYVLEAATGQGISEYASAKLWSKIGTENSASWSLDREDGDEKAFCCFYSIPKDICRLGQLVLQNGDWKGQQLIPQAYLQECMTPATYLWDPKTNAPCIKYGYSWWLEEAQGYNCYYMRGMRGQFLIVIPELDLVVFRAGHMRGKKNERDHPSNFYTITEAAIDLYEQVGVKK